MNTIKAKWYKKGNVKVGSLWTFSLLMGCRVYDTVYGRVKGTCGDHCKYCEKKCYVKKSYRYLSVILSHARNTLAIRQDPEKAAADLSKQIQRARKLPCACRFHQSGEIETLMQLLAYARVAKENPGMTFYIYSKAYNIVVPALLAGLIPNNLVVLISVWHEQGIKEYKRVEHMENVKAFVYDDHDFDYAAAGLDIQTYCHAYDAEGKLDHNVTCDKCRKCFNKLMSCKVIGCYDH